MSTPINDGGAAYPHSQEAHDFVSTGMSLRDWFAGQAMVGVMSNAKLLGYLDEESPSKPTRFVASKYAYDVADAMLAARNNQPEKP